MNSQHYIFSALSISIALTFSLAGCSLFTEQRARLAGGDEVVAELGQHRLYRSEIDAVTATANDTDDSTALADAYIRQWATDLLFYEKAHAREDKQIEQLVDDYRRSLYIHRFEEKLIERRMPKSVEADSITAFYEDNSDLFILHEDILKGVLMIVPNSAPHPEKVKKWMENPDENIELIEKYAYQYASGYQLFTNEWIGGNQILIRMPASDADFSKKLRAGNYLEIRDSTSISMLRITDKHLVGEVMPLDYAEPRIRAAILQKRQVNFLQHYRDALYEEARNGQLKTHGHEHP